MSNRNPLSGLQIKRKIFVSYHHGGDQGYYNRFNTLFSGTYRVLTDVSLDRPLGSENPEYVMRRIREEYLTGSSCTIVLCGMNTWRRKYVDWELKATLEKQHGLIGIHLPTLVLNEAGQFPVPDRLYDNLSSGYAVWINWNSLTAETLRASIELANSQNVRLIQNTRTMMTRNA